MLGANDGLVSVASIMLGEGSQVPVLQRPQYYRLSQLQECKYNPAICIRRASSC